MAKFDNIFIFSLSFVVIVFRLKSTKIYWFYRFFEQNDIFFGIFVVVVYAFTCNKNQQFFLATLFTAIDSFQRIKKKIQFHLYQEQEKEKKKTAKIMTEIKKWTNKKKYVSRYFIEWTDQKYLIDSLPPTPLCGSIRQGYIAMLFCCCCSIVFMVFRFVIYLLHTKKKWSNDDKEASLCLLFKQIVTVYHFWRWFAIKYISFRFSHSFDSINVQRINGTEFTGILKCTVSSTQFFWSGIFRFKAVFNRILHVFFKGFWWKRLSY